MKNKIYVIHENDEWIEPLRKELQEINAPFEEWHLGAQVHTPGDIDTPLNIPQLF